MAKTTLSFTGGSQTYICDTGGTVRVKMWGGGGGGGGQAAPTWRAGGGGFVDATFTVAAGDILRFMVGGGGEGKQMSMGIGAPAGLGGWPDGGKGGRRDVSDWFGGGGGGSSRFYINGVLMAVAGAGGGVAGSNAGAGGGTTGGSSDAGFTPVQSGGTQVAGGTSTLGTAAGNGGFLQGGNADDGNAGNSGGGGGGYYGGGAVTGYTTASARAAGGGSSYTHPSATSVTNTAGTGGTPGGNADADKPANAGNGGIAGSSPNNTSGNAGAIVFDTTITLSKLVFTYTGAAETITITQAGTLLAKLWGAGGAGSSRSTSAGNGGAGAFAHALIPVVPGDVIEVRVGRGGRAQTDTTGGGIGGWPDGGDGGLFVSANYGNGGGGGSSRIFKNGTLVAIAAGGGGASSIFGGGAGGADVGESWVYTTTFASVDYNGSTYNATGGTQSAGGFAPGRPAETASRGTQTKGGNGWQDGGNRTTSTNFSGGGGGGGYWGGGGGSWSSSGLAASGGGGSSYVNPSFSAKAIPGIATYNSQGNTPVRTTDADYASGVGAGGTGTTVFPAGNGGDGRVTLEYQTAALADNKTPCTFTGVPRMFKAPRDGTLVVKMWGGGGGPARWPSPGNPSGRLGVGGYTTVTLQLLQNDVLRVEVGEAGQKGVIWSGDYASYKSTGGLGGWPDGGYGGGSIYIANAGGGGSSRLYVNDVLVAVAAGGGAAGHGSAGARYPGNGGGATGGSGFSELTTSIPGGTQSAGGDNPSTADTGPDGAAFKGGNGFLSTQTRHNPSAAIGSSGGGGGGGYYGGAGGYHAGGSTSGGGGSGYINTAHPRYVSGSTTGTTSGPDAVPPNNLDGDYTGNAGAGGGSSVSDPVLLAGNGYVSLNFVVPVFFGPGDLIPIPYSGEYVEYTANATGTVRFNLTGGGGGGGSDAAPNDRRDDRAGGGGVTSGFVSVVANDVLRVEVGQGGRPATAVSAAGKGIGGWPDGGNGGWGADVGYMGGGGGGSTRLYKNGTLIAVAGAGGGGAYAGGGEGGGTTGAQGSSTAMHSGAALGGGGGGGTQSAGGATGGGATVSVPAGYLRGGNSPSWETSSDHGFRAGGGGGGGYYGGGGGGNASQYRGGGGGSGYINSGVVTGGVNAQAVGRAPVGSEGPPGTGEGAITGISSGVTMATLGRTGGDGFAVLEMAQTLPVSIGTTVSNTNTAKTYVAGADGTMSFELWGGGGGGGTYFAGATNAALKGGGGGYATGIMEFVQGDIIRFEVGGGGAKPGSILAGTNSAGPAHGGLGGWPDGGWGGQASVNPQTGFGGGGGSTRIYKNGTLVAIAAGGGGATGFYQGGGGGGANGGGGGGGSTGGSPIAGGGGTPLETRGSGSLRGGRGGVVPYYGNAAGGQADAGGGGGGGYYGGGSNGTGSGTHIAGAGGSGYVNSALLVEGSTTASTSGSGTAPSGTNKPAGAGNGGAIAATLSGVTAGNAGAAWFTVTPPPVPVALPHGRTTVSYLGVGVDLGHQYFVVTQPEAKLRIRMWGGGGSGGYYGFNYRADRSGGAGGYTDVIIPAVAGDIIRIGIGQGGQVPDASSGGPGGWPDGGNGGFEADHHMRAGSGGGSTRVYKNGVLMAVAGAGGGSTGYYNGGAAGGLTGSKGDTDNANGGTGGSQIAGGVTGGAALQGAHGYNPAGSGNRTTGGPGAGAGGGGGYYGGGTNFNYANTARYSGGGGSGYINTGAGASGTLSGAGTTNNLPPPDPDSLRPTGVGIGGANYGSFPMTLGAGGNGAAIVDLMLPMPTGSDVTVSYSGAPVFYYSKSTAPLTVKAWGAGAGGGYWNGGLIIHARGGTGGYATLKVNLVPDDVVEFRVGGKGKAQADFSQVGGLGGWPDGGDAGFPSSANAAGGGGGSSRVYVNGTLALVAGGGGGGIRWGSGGPGGGTTGVSGDNSFGQGTIGTGGTQSAGGNNSARPADANNLGTQTRGGLGYRVGTSRAVADQYNGAGGGGGYWGGGGSGTTDGSFSDATGGAGGGSSYFQPTAGIYSEGATEAGVVTQLTVPNSTDPKYPAGAGAAGNTGVGSGSDGGNGAVYFILVAGTPATVDVDDLDDVPILLTAPNATASQQVIANFPVTPITLSNPEGGVLIDGPPEGMEFENDIILTAPTGTVDGAGTAIADLIGDLVWVTMDMQLGGQGIIEAIINVPLVDYDIVVSSDLDASVVGSVDYIHTDVIGPIRLTPPRASIGGYTTTEPFENSLVITAPEGLAEYGVDAAQTPFENAIVLDLQVTAVASGGLTVDGKPASGYLTNPSDQFLAQALMIAPQGYVATPDQEVILDLSVELNPITLTVMDGVGENGVDANGLDFENWIYLSHQPQATAAGGYTVDGLPNSGYNTNPADNYLVRIGLSAPAATVTGPANVTALTDDIYITLTVPQVELTRSVTVLASIIPSQIRLSAPRGIAYDGSTTIAVGEELPDILMFAPDATTQIIPQATFDVITMDYVDGFAEVDEPGFAPLRYKRSLVPGNIPTLISREIAINEADGILYALNGDGFVKGTNYGAFRNDAGFAPEGGTIGNVLTAGGWQSASPVVVAPVRQAPPTTTRIALSDAVVSTEIVAPVVGTVYYRPFFVPKKTTVASLAIDVVNPAAATAWIGLCKWNPKTNRPSDTVILGSVPVSTGGIKQTTPAMEVPAGWYAAMINLTGASGATFRASISPKTLDANLNLVGDPTATYDGTLNPAPLPDGRASEAWAIVQAELD